jgi:hypothetical protein
MVELREPPPGGIITIFDLARMLDIDSIYLSVSFSLRAWFPGSAFIACATEAIDSAVAFASWKIFTAIPYPSNIQLSFLP